MEITKEQLQEQYKSLTKSIDEYADKLINDDEESKKLLNTLEDFNKALDNVMKIATIDDMTDEEYFNHIKNQIKEEK